MNCRRRGIAVEVATAVVALLRQINPQSIVALVLLALLFGVSCRNRTPPADLVLVGGMIRTLDPTHPLAEALAIRDGRIVAVGTKHQIEALVSTQTRRIDLSGKVVIPGLVDAHLHLELLGRQAQELDLRGLGLKEILTRVREASERTPPGRPIMGRGWDQNRWSGEDCPFVGCLDDEGFPGRGLLDWAAEKNPVILTRVDGHAIWANGAALRLAGIEDIEKSPAGGRIGRDSTGSPTGVLVDAAMPLLEDHLPKATDGEIRQSVLLAQENLLALGLTGVHDMGTGPDVLRVLRQLDLEGKLRLRVHSYIWGNEGDLEELLAKAKPLPNLPTRKLSVVGVKLMVDGALGSRGAALLERYSDASHRGQLLLTEEELEARVRSAVNHGLGVAIHAIGDRANRIVLDVYERLRAISNTVPRLRVEHAQVLAPVDIARFPELGVVASMQPTHATSDMPWAKERLGAKRLAGAYAWERLRVAGATLAAGSDAPVESADPRLGLYAARTRSNLDGKPVGGWYPRQRMAPATALKGFTTGAAYAVGAEDHLGRIAAGYFADLTVLDADPVQASDRKVLALQVAMTIVGGEVAYSR